MPSFQQKELQSIPKGKKYSLKKQTKHQNQTQIRQRFLNLSHQEFKITMNNMLRSLKGKVYNMAKKMETLTKNFHL